MPQHIAHITLLVRDYDEARDYYSRVLGFAVVEDTPLDDGKRWLLLAPPGSRETRLLLAKASSPGQLARVGDQAGGRVLLFLHTDDFWRDYHAFRARGAGNQCADHGRRSHRRCRTADGSNCTPARS